MHRPRAIFSLSPFFYIQPNADKLVGHAQFFRINAAERPFVVLCSHPLANCANGAEWESAIIELGNGICRPQFRILCRVGGGVKCACGIAVDGDMVWVPVGAAFIKGDDNLWSKFA